MLKLPFYMLRRLGFNETRVIWIKGCLASSSVSILINGRPTKEFMLQKGLRQGDPLAPFLFNIVGKGLSGLMRETTSKNLFSGFKVGKNNVEVNLLQYVDDTIYIGEMSLNNVVVIKSILWCFKLASRLKVIFLKSRFGAIGVDGEAIEKYARYLNCRILNLPFMYLGLPNGVNSRKVET